MSGKEYMHMGKRECEEAGKVWVEDHMRSMTYVHGYVSKGRGGWKAGAETEEVEF